MTEDDALAWLSNTLDVSRETIGRVEAFRCLLLEENTRQNLISAQSETEIWARHFVDSAQLLTEVTAPNSWLDLGTGAGFPGLLVAILNDVPMTLVEARKRRVEFLTSIVDALDLRHVHIHHGRVEAMESQTFDVITARAFAPLTKTFQIAERFAYKNTVWLLPKGRSAQTELETARKSWQGVFHVKQSVTDPEAGIIVARGVRRLRAR